MNSENTIRLVSWNVNGLRAVLEKGFYDSVASLQPDVLCLQETKMQPGQCEVNLPGYRQIFHSAEKKGYSGTAVFTRLPILGYTTDIGVEEHSHEGRVITCEFAGFYLVCCYTPNSQDGLKRLDYRMRWEDDFRAYLMKLDAVKPVILCGDLNVAHEEIDLKNPATNHKNAGFSDEEREKMSQLLGSGFADSFRRLYPEKVKYSWWSYRMKARERNAGWRIDYFIVSERLLSKVQSSEIHNDIYGSDHCPVSILLNCEAKQLEKEEN